MSRRTTALLAIGALTAVTAGLAPLGAAVANNPPGNNGTVKIDGVDFDTHPNNEPHVGCRFQVDWYGFDEGAVSTVTFEAQPPTGWGTLLVDQTVFVGGDDASGGGSEAGLDREKTYNLGSALRGYKEHPKQGFHVKLTINTTGSQGADVKHKVFWVQGCYGGGY